MKICPALKKIVTFSAFLLIFSLFLESCSSYEPVTYGEEKQYAVKLLLYDDEDNPALCSGVVVNSTTVLTAAHCVPEFIVSGKVVTPLQSTHTISAFIVHPQYNQSTSKGGEVHHDLALLHVSSPFSYSSYPTIASGSPTPHDELVVFGYGKNSLNHQQEGVLHRGLMQVTSIEGAFFTAIEKEKILAVCHGDSGGPAFIQGRGHPLLSGIISMGTDKKCRLGERTYFTTLSDSVIRSFLEEHNVTTFLEENSHQ